MCAGRHSVKVRRDEWILPAGIPFAELKGRDLEECVYWLLDAMGARDLEWRIGGTGGGAADGGRDIEATFYVPGPDGEMEPQRWWVECKGRKGTVEAAEVQSAVNNSTAQDDLSYLLIVTNTQFSNPTRDWVKRWQGTHPRPRVKLWDQGSLERQLTQHPDVVLRLFSSALSPTGLLRALQQRFWDRFEYMPVKALHTLWSERHAITFDPLERAALVANELAHGSITARPWAALADPSEIVETLALAFQNLGYLVVIADRAGVDQKPIMAMLAHLIIAALRRFNAQLVASVLNECMIKNGQRLPDQVVDILLLPVLGRVAGELQDICVSDCTRIYTSEPSTLAAGDDSIASYWRRFDPAGNSSDDENRGQLRLESHDGECKVGFPVDRDYSCPLFSLEATTSNLAEFLAVMERISDFRFTEAQDRYAEEDEGRQARK
ncbi:hypothetical protein FMM79_04620 [Novosphingobium sp. BW1]|nr:hypothetical protein FMM79_04620 [Novosphingobium sp. BW1]